MYPGNKTSEQKTIEPLEPVESVEPVIGTDENTPKRPSKRFIVIALVSVLILTMVVLVGWRKSKGDTSRQARIIGSARAAEMSSGNSSSGKYKLFSGSFDRELTLNHIEIDSCSNEEKGDFGAHKQFGEGVGGYTSTGSFQTGDQGEIYFASNHYKELSGHIKTIKPFSDKSSQISASSNPRSINEEKSPLESNSDRQVVLFAHVHADTDASVQDEVFTIVEQVYQCVINPKDCTLREVYPKSHEIWEAVMQKWKFDHSSVDVESAESIIQYVLPADSESVETDILEILYRLGKEDLVQEALLRTETGIELVSYQAFNAKHILTFINVGAIRKSPNEYFYSAFMKCPWISVDELDMLDCAPTKMILNSITAGRADLTSHFVEKVDKNQLRDLFKYLASNGRFNPSIGDENAPCIFAIIQNAKQRTDALKATLIEKDTKAAEALQKSLESYITYLLSRYGKRSRMGLLIAGFNEYQRNK